MTVLVVDFLEMVNIDEGNVEGQVRCIQTRWQFCFQEPSIGHTGERISEELSLIRAQFGIQRLCLRDDIVEMLFEIGTQLGWFAEGNFPPVALLRKSPSE